MFHIRNVKCDENDHLLSILCRSFLQLGAYSQVCQWAVWEVPERGAACYPQEENTWQPSPLLHLFSTCYWTQVSNTCWLVFKKKRVFVSILHGFCKTSAWSSNLVHRLLWKHHPTPIWTEKKRFWCCVCGFFRLRSIDIEFMKRLGRIVSIVPVIAKADTLTIEERQEFKERVNTFKICHASSGHVM